MGVPLDDTWIHFQFADNFSQGNFFQYNPGEYTAGTTSPLYVVILGISGLISKAFIFNSVFISFVFYVLSCIFIYRLSLLLFENVLPEISFSGNLHISAEFLSLLISLLTVFSGRICWAALSGMETTMFIFFCIAGVYFHLKDLKQSKFSFLPVLFISLATVSRPEGFLLIAIYYLDLILNLVQRKVFGKYFFRFIVSFTLFAVITFPYLIFSHEISGYFFPNTFRGQGGNFRFIPDFEYLRIVMVYFFQDNLITGVLYFFSIAFYIFNIKKYFTEFRYFNVIFLWIILLPLVSSLLIPNWRHHARYLIPLIPFINVISLYLITEILKFNFSSEFRKFVSEKKSVLSLVIILSLIYYIVYAVALGKNTDNINDQQVKLAKWVISNVKRNETIAVNDIGAITFLSKNRIIDMAGLITPEILRYRNYQWQDNLDSLNRLLKKNNVSYIIIYDDWFKEYLNKYKDSLIYITSAVLEDNTICGGKEMKVYKTKFYKQEN